MKIPFRFFALERSRTSLRALTPSAIARTRRAETLEKLKQLAQQTYVQPLWVALIHVASGEKDQALDGLQAASTAGPPDWSTSRWAPFPTRCARDSGFLGLLPRVRF